MISKITFGTIKFMVETEINNHGLKGWKFKLTNGKRQHGYCDWSNSIIAISKHYIGTELFDELKDTVLHEIAHALAGPKNGHNHEWKMICSKIGASPERISNIAIYEDYKYSGWCPNCQKHLINRHRRTLGALCGVCKTPVQWIMKG